MLIANAQLYLNIQGRTGSLLDLDSSEPAALVTATRKRLCLFCAAQRICVVSTRP
ncbi:hypothetical protein PISMIDRAFT_518920 [Pisolithus microcarpus 441]|uniref:Uncharacterized protein n=1 Tax=Pisolithus microcarpus 441 TaxID=765257 RepID=A0A0C9ZIS4_9AGAM|nr:hypothetical protein PISMIDRAFT_518920 [Pisolithus microcarpus 441]